MMKKTASALAAAALLGTGAASAATFQINDDTALSVYGNLQLKYNTTDFVQDDGSTEDSSSFTDNGSTIGFAAEHQFDNGLTGYGRAEFEHNADEAKSSNGLDTGDQAYLGLRGDFGAVQAGSWDGIYADAIYDLIDPFESASLDSESATAEGDQIAYFSPNFNGFSFEVQARVRGDAENVGDDFTNLDDPSNDAQAAEESDEEVGFAAVAKYTADNWAVHAGYDDRGANELGVDPATGEVVFDDEPTYGIGGAYDFGQFTLSGRYALEELRDEADAGDDVAYYGVLGSFDYGQGAIYGGVQEVDPDEGDSKTQFSVGANYEIGSNLYVFAEYGDRDEPDSAVGADDSLYEVGAVYSF